MLFSSGQKQVILACHITGVFDVNRNNTLPHDSYELVQEWVDSVTALKIQGVLFHNNFTEATCELFQNEYVTFVRIVHNPLFNPNVYRYFVYRDYIRDRSHEIVSFFVTDSSDVVVLNNPFHQPLFVDNPTALFCGDELKYLDNDWMKAHATLLRGRIADYADYEKTFATETLLNCGIIGGNMTLMQPFIEVLCQIHEQYNHDNQTAYTGDMGAFNYLARTRFNEQLIHGEPVNTVFKAYQTDRTDCWFRHK
ncbi:hypothetical protein [Spirosoma fluviale]|uniref:Uncharacterized protein n=1 Tax=Spirosoma fluviale TaxID=1597977 RepID=A0A286FD35_9BACT|nr:hypothetical protein [Spirosoma fluviale]SOD81145.1 hypothetical protein SAMN06269250_1689 [Spirosoma fluviale]